MTLNYIMRVSVRMCLMSILPTRHEGIEKHLVTVQDKGYWYWNKDNMKFKL